MNFFKNVLSKRVQNGTRSDSAKRGKLAPWAKLKASLRYYEAVRKADKAHSKNGNRYYVMPTTGTSGQLVIIDRNNFRKLKLKHYINNSSFVRDIEIECFYCTPYRNGMGALSPTVIAQKRKQYFSWLKAINL